MQSDEDGKLKPLTDDKILEAMQEFAEESLKCYIMEQKKCASSYEAMRVAKMFFESELF